MMKTKKYYNLQSEKWSKTLDFSLHLMANNGILCDFELVCGSHRNEIVKAHSCVMACASPYVYNLITNAGSTSPFNILLDGKRQSALQQFVKFCYTGHVTVYEEDLADVAECAKLFQVAELTTLCTTAAASEQDTHTGLLGVSPVPSSCALKQTIDEGTFQVTTTSREDVRTDDQHGNDTANKNIESNASLQGSTLVFNDVNNLTINSIENPHNLTANAALIQTKLSANLHDEALRNGAPLLNDHSDLSYSQKTGECKNDANIIHEERADNRLVRIRHNQIEPMKENEHAEFSCSDNEEPVDNECETQVKDNSETDTKKFLCKTCGKMSTNAASIRMCEYRHRNYKSGKNHKCDWCGKVFMHRANLMTHIKGHLNVKNFACRFCVKTFLRKSELEWHERIHTGEKPHKCKFCGRSFTQKSNLKNHEHIHTGVKPYICKTCSKSFANKSNLNRHESQCLVNKDKEKTANTGKQECMLKYQCNICPKSFKRRRNLEDHERTHNGEKPFKCDLCSQEFARQPNLIRHKKYHDKLTADESKMKQMQDDTPRLVQKTISTGNIKLTLGSESRSHILPSMQDLQTTDISSVLSSQLFLSNPILHQLDKTNVSNVQIISNSLAFPSVCSKSTNLNSNSNVCNEGKPLSQTNVELFNSLQSMKQVTNDSLADLNTSENSSKLPNLNDLFSPGSFMKQFDLATSADNSGEQNEDFDVMESNKFSMEFEESY